MTALMRFIDRLRLRGAPEQVVEATRLYRDMRYDGMVMSNILGHAIHVAVGPLAIGRAIQAAFRCLSLSLPGNAQQDVPVRLATSVCGYRAPDHLSGSGVLLPLAGFWFSRASKALPWCPRSRWRSDSV